MVERRAPAKRFDVVLFIGDAGPPSERRPTEEAVPLGRTRNLSASGIFVETSMRPELETTRKITLVWGDEAVSCDARVVRHTDDGIALRFEEPSPAFAHAIADITRQSAP